MWNNNSVRKYDTAQVTLTLHTFMFPEWKASFKKCPSRCKVFAHFLPQSCHNRISRQDCTFSCHNNTPWRRYLNVNILKCDTIIPKWCSIFCERGLRIKAICEQNVVKMEIEVTTCKYGAETICTVEVESFGNQTQMHIEGCWSFVGYIIYL